MKFYQQFLAKLLKVFDFKSDIFNCLSIIDPAKSQVSHSSIFDKIEENIPISFDKAAVKLQHREFTIDDEVSSLVEQHEDAIKFWLDVSKLRSPMGSDKYPELSTLALNLLAIPASNADSERVFSLVCRIKTEFRLSLASETVSSLIRKYAF